MLEDSVYKVDLSTYYSSEKTGANFDFDAALRLMGWAQAMNFSSFLIQEVRDIGKNKDFDDDDDGQEEPALI